MSNAEVHYALVQTFVEGKLLYQNGFYETCANLESERLFLERAMIHFGDPENPGNSPADLILCDADFFSVLRAQPLPVKHPQRGERVQIIQNATRNAELALSRIMVKPTSQTALDRLRDALKLPNRPSRIWCTDISHFQGTEIVGVVICFVDGKPDKSQYRKFLIQTVKDKSDDPRSIMEVVQRRLQGVNAENPAPDLWIIDGGKPQLNFAQSALHLSGYSQIPLVAIAKKEELLFVPGRPVPIRISHHDPALKLVQKIRDETHRFAITFQRNRRKKSIASLLEDIPKMGPIRSKKLYAHFKTLEALNLASVQEIAKIGGMSHEIAESVKAHVESYFQ
jgi:excinuclease ABC subunit C